VTLGMQDPGDGKDRLAQVGLELREEDGKMVVDAMAFGSEAERAGFDFDYEIVSLKVAADRPDKQWFYIPALVLLGGVFMVQRGRRNRAAAVTA
jgi:hypothetical protein